VEGPARHRFRKIRFLTKGIACEVELAKLTVRIARRLRKLALKAHCDLISFFHTTIGVRVRLHYLVRPFSGQALNLDESRATAKCEFQECVKPGCAIGDKELGMLAWCGVKLDSFAVPCIVYVEPVMARCAANFHSSQRLVGQWSAHSRPVLYRNKCEMSHNRLPRARLDAPRPVARAEYQTEIASRQEPPGLVG
jgi:hypothetical protein